MTTDPFAPDVTEESLAHLAKRLPSLKSARVLDDESSFARYTEYTIIRNVDGHREVQLKKFRGDRI